MGNCCDVTQEIRDEVDNNKERNPRSLRQSVCCTDIVILILFIAFWCFLAFIAIMSLIQGDSRRVINGYDTSGNLCNVEKNKDIANFSRSGQNTLGKPYVFFMSSLYPRTSMQLCISKCPTRKLSTKQDVIDFYETDGVNLCQYDTKPSLSVDFKSNGPCPSLPIYKSIPIMARCVPDPVALANDTRKYNVTQGFVDLFHMDEVLSHVVSDIYACWRQLIALFLLAVVVAFLMVLMMRFLAPIIVWFIVILACLGSIVGTGVLWYIFVYYLKSDVVQRFAVPIIGGQIKKQTAFLIFAIIASILTIVLLLLLLIMRKRISLVVALFKEAGKCLADIPLLLIQPIWTFLIYALVMMYFVFILACIITMGTPAKKKSIGDFESVKFSKSVFEKQFWWIHVIGWIWTSEFILAAQQYVITSSVSIWYFTANKKTLGAPILKSIATLICNHLGSIAFGSMIIAIVKIIRYILMYIESKCKGSENACARCCLKCCICCLWCLEKVLKFLHQNAYTVMAIEGTNFCTSAKKAFEIVTSNALRVAAINSVGDFVLFLGKIGVMCLSGLFAALWLRTIPEIYYVAIPVLLVCIFSFLIAHCFLSVFEMVVDALLICFCEDCQRNDGSPGREYFMSHSLMEFVTDSSAKLDKLKTYQDGNTGENTVLKASAPADL